MYIKTNNKDEATIELNKIAKLIHYPDCWDTNVYRTLFEAIIEIHNNDCSVCNDLIES